MIDRLKSVLPQGVRKALQPLYNRTVGRWKRRRRRSLVGRDWDLDFSVPRNLRPQFYASAIEGRLDFEVDGEHTNILLCAQPKSASLYMAQMLSLALGFKNHQIGFDHAGGEIYYPRLLAAKFTGRDTLSHCHGQATSRVLTMIRMLNLRPLVLTRNLPDALVSRRDMLVRDGATATMLSKRAMEQFMEGSGEYQMDVIIDLFANTYINFYAGWDRLRGDEELRPCYITYRELIEDEPALVRKVAEHFGLTVPEETVERLSRSIEESGGINYNTGRTGRGMKNLNERQVGVLREKARRLGCRDEEFLGFPV